MCHYVDRKKKKDDIVNESKAHDELSIDALLFTVYYVTVACPLRL